MRTTYIITYYENFNQIKDGAKSSQNLHLCLRNRTDDIHGHALLWTRHACSRMAINDLRLLSADWRRVDVPPVLAIVFNDNIYILYSMLYGIEGAWGLRHSSPSSPMDNVYCWYVIMRTDTL